MKTKQLTRVRGLYNSEFATQELNRYNQRAWVRAIRILGDKWVLAKYQEKLDNVAPRVLINYN